MSRKICLSIILIFSVMTISAQMSSKERFLGSWILEDGSNSIKVIKEEGLYYIIEFVRIKHELFFSGDGKRALFQEWGKGATGICGLQLGANDKTLLYYGVSDTGDWVLSYRFYQKP
ncbi:MAG: hypothetical protein ACYC2S_09535 [Spirochaetales bacterium]